MHYSDITSYPRHYDKQKYPVVTQIRIAAHDLSKFERLAEDQTQIVVLGHDLADDDCVDVHVGCTSEAARRRLESRWT